MMENYTPSPILLAHIKKSEGYRSRAYRDSVGVWTIGFGHTRGVKPTDRCTESQAEAWLMADIRHHAQQLAPHVKVKLTQAQMDALVDMAFNVGVSAVAKSTLLRYVNEQRSTREIQAQFLRWNKAGGRPLEGLTKRCRWRADRWQQ